MLRKGWQYSYAQNAVRQRTQTDGAPCKQSTHHLSTRSLCGLTDFVWGFCLLRNFISRDGHPIRALIQSPLILSLNSLSRYISHQARKCYLQPAEFCTYMVPVGDGGTIGNENTWRWSKSLPTARARNRRTSQEQCCYIITPTPPDNANSCTFQL